MKTELQFKLVGLPEEGDLFGYEDYRLDEPDRGLFYVGIGTRTRVKIPDRSHNRGHCNISRKHGILRKVVRTFRTVEEMNQWEIHRIKEIRESKKTLVNKADGGGGTRGLMPCRNLITGETKVFRLDQIPDGWVHSSTGMVPCENIITKERTNFSNDSIPDGWIVISSGRMLCKNLTTGEIAQFKNNEMPDGWVGVNKGRASFRNKVSGETAMFDVHEVPDGWEHVSVGQAMCRNLTTGETKSFPKDQIPDGWAGVTKGKVACKNPETGETGSFLKDEIPQGWVGIAKGNKIEGSIEQTLLNLINNNPDLTRSDLYELARVKGWNKSTIMGFARKHNMETVINFDEEFDNRFKILLSFVEKNNRLPKIYEKFEEFKLGRWAHQQRQKFSRGNLSEDRISKLESIKCWVWSKNKAAFIDQFEILQKFIENNNRLPKTEEEYEGNKIGSWVVRIRTKYRKGVLKTFEISKLQSLNEWKWNS